MKKHGRHNHGTASNGSHTIAEMCRALGKDFPYVRNLQSALHLPARRRPEKYSDGYLRFLEKVVALRTFCVSQEQILELLEIEKKILVLLHIDSLSDSMTWYLDGCVGARQGDEFLLLTGINVGFTISRDGPGHVQHHLDFCTRDPELFEKAEMGEDVVRVLAKYLDLVESLQAKIMRETLVLRSALEWADRAFARHASSGS